MGSASSRILISAPMLTPAIWLKHACMDALNVGSITDIAPSMAKMSLSPVPPNWSAISMAAMTAMAVLIVRRPIGNLFI